MHFMQGLGPTPARPHASCCVFTENRALSRGRKKIQGRALVLQFLFASRVCTMCIVFHPKIF